MTDFALLAASSDWEPAYRQRLIDAYRATGLPEPAAAEFATSVIEQGDEWTAAAILDEDGRRIGQVVVSLTEQQGSTAGRIGELWTDADHDAQGSHRRAAHTWARRWCAEHGAGRVGVRLAAPDELFADYPVRAQTRIKVVTTPAEPPAGVTHRPMTEAEYPAWLAAGQERYAAEMVQAGARTPEQARQKAEEDYRTLLPEGVSTPTTPSWCSRPTASRSAPVGCTTTTSPESPSASRCWCTRSSAAGATAARPWPSASRSPGPAATRS